MKHDTTTSSDMSSLPPFLPPSLPPSLPTQALSKALGKRNYVDPPPIVITHKNQFLRALQETEKRAFDRYPILATVHRNTPLAEHDEILKRTEGVSEAEQLRYRNHVLRATSTYLHSEGRLFESARRATQEQQQHQPQRSNSKGSSRKQRQRQRRPTPDEIAARVQLFREAREKKMVYTPYEMARLLTATHVVVQHYPVNKQRDGYSYACLNPSSTDLAGSMKAGELFRLAKDNECVRVDLCDKWGVWNWWIPKLPVEIKPALAKKAELLAECGFATYTTMGTYATAYMKESLAVRHKMQAVSATVWVNKGGEPLWAQQVFASNGLGQQEIDPAWHPQNALSNSKAGVGSAREVARWFDEMITAFNGGEEGLFSLRAWIEEVLTINKKVEFLGFIEQARGMRTLEKASRMACRYDDLPSFVLNFLYKKGIENQWDFESWVEEEGWVPLTKKAREEAQGMYTPLCVFLSEYGQRGGKYPSLPPSLPSSLPPSLPPSLECSLRRARLLQDNFLSCSSSTTRPPRTTTTSLTLPPLPPSFPPSLPPFPFQVNSGPTFRAWWRRSGAGWGAVVWTGSAR